MQTAPMLKNARNPEALFAGVFCAASRWNTRQVRRVGKKRAKRKEERRWRREEGL